MDFVRILRSLEEVVYEAMTWIVFYPRTLWWSAVSPLRMLRYGQRELADSPDDQYTETLSPVLFLMITLALSHGLSQALAPAAMELRGAMARLMSSEQNQLITRSVAFAIFPLVFASQQLRRLHVPGVGDAGHRVAVVVGEPAVGLTQPVDDQAMTAEGRAPSRK